MQNSKFESTKNPTKHCINVRGKLLDLSVPKVMAILNITPDSFYSGSRVSNEAEILERVKNMLNDGADILDVGGYSTRPGADNISEAEEMDRVAPVIAAIHQTFPDAIISIDTFRSNVAKTALECGASIINDISGFEIDPDIADVAAENNVPYILMHMRGTPQTMTSHTNYDNLFMDIASYFSKKIQVLQNKGVKDIIIDPGFGFSKTIEQNYQLLEEMENLSFLNKPILLGISRKSMIYKKLGIKPEEALNGTIALNAIGLSKGANILRVHDVKEAVELVRLLA